MHQSIQRYNKIRLESIGISYSSRGRYTTPPLLIESPNITWNPDISPTSLRIQFKHLSTVKSPLNITLIPYTDKTHTNSTKTSTLHHHFHNKYHLEPLHLPHFSSNPIHTLIHCQMKLFGSFVVCSIICKKSFLDQ